MPTRPTAPRLTPLPESLCTPEQKELLAPLGASGSLHIFRTLVRHPRLFRRWSPFAGTLLARSHLSDRERELVILRVAWRCAAGYEWGQHVAIAREAGLTDDEISLVAEPTVGAAWPDSEAALLAAVDELHDDHCITDATWGRLADGRDDEQLIEITMLAGSYAMLAGTLNSLGVQLEGDQPSLGQV